MGGPASSAGTKGESGLLSPQRPDAFISYAREERGFVAELLVPHLTRAGKRVWVDLEDIPPAADWEKRVWRGIRAAKAVICVISPSSVRSEACRREWDEAARLNKRLVPILGADIGRGDVPDPLRVPNWVLLRPDDDQERGLGLVVEALESDLAWRDAHARLTERAQEWSSAERDRSFLLSGGDLRQAERWLAEQGEHREAATPEQVEYIVAGRVAATRRHRIVVTSIVLALAVTAVLAVVALLQRSRALDQAQTARSRELSALAVAQLDVDPLLAEVLARAGVSTKSTSQAIGALRRAVAVPRSTGSIPLDGDPSGPPSVSADGRYVLQATGPAGVVIWEMSTHRPVRKLSVPAAPETRVPSYVAPPPRVTASFDGSGRFAVTLGSDHVIRVWNWRRGQQVASSPETGDELATSHAGTSVATGGQAIHVWNWSAGSTSRFGQVGAGIASLSFNPAGTALVSGGDRATRWDVITRSKLDRLPAHDDSWVEDAKYSPDGRYVATAASNGYVDVWSVARTPARRVASFSASTTNLRAATFSPDGHTLATGGDDGVVTLWDWRTGDPVVRLHGHRGAVEGMAFARNGQDLVTTADDQTLRFWRVPRRSEPLTPRGFDATSATLHPNGRLLAVGGAAYGINTTRATALVDIRTRRVIGWLQSGTGPVGDFAARVFTSFSPEGAFIAAAVEDRGYVDIWDWKRRSRVARLQQGNRVRVAAFDRGGRLLATSAADGTIRIWDWRARRVVASLRLPRRGLEGFASPVAWAANGRVLVVGNTDALDVWDWRARRMLASQATTSQVNEVAVNPHGDVAAAALADGGTLVWQWKARHVRSLVSTVGALAASFSPDGTLLAVGYTDGETRLWDWAAREVIASFRPIGSRPTDNPEGVADVEVTPRGPAVVASVDGRAFVYGCPACAPLAALLADSALAARRLDRSERNRYRQLVGD